LQITVAVYIVYLTTTETFILTEYEDYAEIVDNDEFDDYSQPLSGDWI
jgi:hypothetical protein